MTVSTLSTHVPAPVNVVLMRGLLSAAKRTFPYLNGTMPGLLENNMGSLTVKWRRIENLAAATTALGEVTGTAAFGMGRTAVTPTITDLTQAVAKYGNFINYSEELDLVNINSRAAQLLDTLGENAGHTFNALMAAVMDAETTDNYAGAATSTATTALAIALDDVKYCVNQLNRNSAMKFFPMGTGSTNITTSTIRSSYFGIVHPDVEEDIRDLAGFIGVEQYGGYTSTFNGEFGAAAGVRWSMSEIAPISAGGGATTSLVRNTSGSADVYSTFIYGREAVGSVGFDQGVMPDDIYMGSHSTEQPVPIDVINKAIGSSGVADPLNEVGSIGWKGHFAGKVLNGNWFQKLETAASLL